MLCMISMRVVITSTWREAHSLSALRQYFSEALRSRIVDCTPQLEETDVDHLRYREIRAWLNQHPEVTRWAALDDDREGFPESQRRRVVLTDSSTGLSPSDLEVVRALLTSA